MTYMFSTFMRRNLERIGKRSKWEKADYICRGHNLNDMSDSLFDICQKGRVFQVTLGGTRVEVHG